MSAGRAGGAGNAPMLFAGLGSAGRRHLRNYAALAREAGDEAPAVLYRTGHGPAGTAALEPIPDAPPGAVTETDLAAALAHRPRAAVIASPTSLHVPTALACAEAGCGLLIEKPLSHTTDGLDALERAVETRGLVAVVGFMFRFHPTLRQVHAWLAGGAIGRTVLAEARWGEYLPGWHPAEDHRAGYSARCDLGGGPVHTLSHPLDYLRWLLGAAGEGDVAAVQAVTAQRAGLGIETEDVAAATLTFETGALATVALDFAARPPRHGLYIAGSEGSIRWDFHTGEAALYRAGKGEWTTAVLPAGFERNDLFLAEMRHFLACLEGAETPVCTLRDGRRAVEVALAIHRAAAERCEVPV